MGESNFSSRPDKNNPDTIDLSRVFAHEASSTPNDVRSNKQKVHWPTVLVCLAVCLATVLSCVLVSVGTYFYMKAKGISAVTQKTIVNQSVTMNASVGTFTPTEEQIATVAACTESVVEILAAENELAYHQGSYGMGSGLVWGSGADELGGFSYIVTNYHVVEDCSYIWVKTAQDDAFSHQALVVGYDAQNDLALLEIAKSGLRPVLPATRADLRIGLPVFAIGNPLGVLGTSVTYGGISAVDREIPVNDASAPDGYRTMVLIQHDAAINNGNSGGGLFDYTGRLLGVVNAKISATGVEGLGYAIPIDTAQAIIQSIIQNNTVARPLIGIGVFDYDGLLETKEQIAQSTEYSALAPFLTPGVDGVYVYVKNIAECPLQVGDCLLAIGKTTNPFQSKQIDSLEDLRLFLSTCVAGETVYLSVYRNNDFYSIPLVLFATQ